MAERDHGVGVGDVEHDVFGDLRRAGIAGRDKKPREQRAFCQRQRQRVFAAAGANKKNVHMRLVLRFS